MRELLGLILFCGAALAQTSAIGTAAGPNAFWNNPVFGGIQTDGPGSGAWCPQANTSLVIVCFAIPNNLASGGTLNPPALGNGTYTLATNPLTGTDQVFGSGDTNGALASAISLPNCSTGLTYTTAPTSAFGCIHGPTVLYSTASATDQLSAATGTNQQSFATSYTFPADLFTGGTAIRVTYTVGLTTSGTPASMHFQLYLGSTSGTPLFDTSVVTPAAGLTSRSGLFTCVITGTAAPGSSEPLVSSCGAGFANATPWNFLNTVSPSVSVATNGSLALTAVMTYGATTAGNTSNIYSMLVEQLN